MSFFVAGWSSLVFAAQPVLAMGFDNTTNDGGWVGENARFYCERDCAGLAGLLVEARPEPGTWGPGSFDASVPNHSRTTFFYVHLGRYALRLSAEFTDGGRDAPRPEFVVTADMASGTPPGPMSVLAFDGGSISFGWPAATDDGSGVAFYAVYAAWAPDPAQRFGFLGGGPAPTLGTTHGPGTWNFMVDAYDLVNRYGGSGTLPGSLTIVASSAIAVPPAPTPTQLLFPSRDVSFTLAPVGDAWTFLAESEDGGVFAGIVGRQLGGSTQVNGYIGECRYRIRGSISIDGSVSDWSLPSPWFTVDVAPPSTPVSPLVARTSGAITLSWPASTDSCSGVEGYEVERDVDAGAWGPVGPRSPGLTRVDAPGDEARRYRVRAVDLAGHPSDWADVPLAAVPLDAGLTDAGLTDAGLTDAGLTDAGLTDAGPMTADDAGVSHGPSILRVGCGCGAGDPADLVLGLCFSWRVRRRRRPLPRA